MVAMTLYDEPEAILQRSAELAARCAQSTQDAELTRELRQMARLLNRIAAMWPQMFAAINRENEILATARASVQAAMEGAGTAVPPMPDDLTSDDPLVRYRAELIAADTLSRRLHELVDQPWAGPASRTLRQAISATADTQGPLVDAAFAF